MRNFKRIVALSLVCILALGLMVTASAYTYKDQAKIDSKYVKAIDMLYELGIMQGSNDNFNPTGLLKRSEICKTAYVISSGGKTDAAYYANYEGAVFTDVKSADWFAGFVNYCKANGFIDGTSKTKFTPNGTLKVSEAAKVLLTLMGYKTTYQNYTGAGWDLHVMSDAENAGLMEGLDDIKNITAAVTREQFAQMIYNALYGEMVAYDTQIVPPDWYGTATTLLIKKFGLTEITGVLEANEYAALGVALADAGKVKIDGYTNQFAVTAPLDYLGREVKLYVKGSATAPTKIYGGVSLANTDSVVEIAAEKIAASLSIGGVDYTGGDNGTTFVNFQAKTLAQAAAAGVAQKSNIARMIVKGKDIQYILSQDLAFGKVSLAADGKVTVTNVAGLTSIDPAKIVNKELAVKDALVMGAQISTNTFVLYATTTVEGAADEIYSDKLTVLMGGKTYTIGRYTGAAAAGYVTLKTDNTYYLFGNNLLGAEEKVVTDTYCVLIDSEYTKTTGDMTASYTPRVQVIYGDGKIETVALASYNGTLPAAMYASSTTNGATNPRVSLVAPVLGVNDASFIPVDALCKYSLSSDGKITLTAVTAGATATVAGATSKNTSAGASRFNPTANAADAKVVNGDSVFFVKTTGDGGKWNIYTGRTLPQIDAGQITGGMILHSLQSAKANDTVVAAALVTNQASLTGGTTTDILGVLVRAPRLSQTGTTPVMLLDIAVNGVVTTYTAEKLHDGTLVDGTTYDTYEAGSLITIKTVNGTALTKYDQENAFDLDGTNGGVYGYFTSYDATNKLLVLSAGGAGALGAADPAYDTSASIKFYTVTSAGVVTEASAVAAAAANIEAGYGNVVALVDKDIANGGVVTAVYCLTDGKW